MRTYVCSTCGTVINYNRRGRYVPKQCYDCANPISREVLNGNDALTIPKQ